MMRCPEGHPSEEPDYCSVCGRAMGAAGLSPLTPGGSACPSCGEPRVDAGARYCEVCRYDFVALAAGAPPVAAPKPPVASTPAPPPPAPAPTAAPAGWELVVTVDASQDKEPDPATPCPTDTPERVIPLDQDVLVGRRDDQRDIHPDLEVVDPGASRRHAKFVRLDDGTIALQDLASTNGTRLNAADLAPGSRHPLRAGDEVHLGRWTCIVLRARS
jgi:hypothetical protein